MKNHLITLALILFLSSYTSAQENIENTVKKVTDLILSENIEGLRSQTGQVYTDFLKLPKGETFEINSRYRGWYYWNGVLNIAMLEMHEYFNDKKYQDYTRRNYRFVFDNYQLFKKMDSNKKLEGLELLWEMRLLDHCGAMGAGLVEAYKLDKRADYKEYLELVADYILYKELKLEDGTLSRNFFHKDQVWLDDLYMSIPFLARMGDLTKDKKYFDFAAKQVKQFTNYMWCEQTKLYYHTYYGDIKEQGVAHWGRANGWSIMAQADLLSFLPSDHPDRQELLRIFKQQILGFALYQSESGLWHQLLDRSDSYLETSCTAMFTYAVAKAVNEGWLDKRYATIAIHGWNGISTMVNEKGEVGNICVGTGTSPSMVDYYKRPTKLNDIHGLGAVILAGVEVLKLKN